MNEITIDQFSKWLEEYGSAWQTGDVQSVVTLFAHNARYEETPFDAPMIGREAIARYWDEGANKSQKEIRFHHQILAVLGATGLATWQASFIRVPSGIHVDLDGVLAADFTPEGTCVRFREWWHRVERSP
jgi:ketosteroid isomerase-like protein